MRGPDHTRRPVGEQHRGAIGRNDAQQQPRPVRHERISLGPVVVVPGIGHGYASRGMGLVDSDQPETGRDRGGSTATVLADGPLRIA
jgi:hypothetical protein